MNIRHYDKYTPEFLSQYFYAGLAVDGGWRLFHAINRGAYTGIGKQIAKGEIADESLTGEGYRRVFLPKKDGRQIQLVASAIIWVLYHKRPIPEGFVVDHENRDTLDNDPIRNLRCVRYRANAVNRPTCDNKLLGVKLDKRRPAGSNRYEARARDPVGKKHHYLGMFRDSTAAAKAYDAYVISAYGADTPTNASLGRI